MNEWLKGVKNGGSKEGRKEGWMDGSIEKIEKNGGRIEEEY